MYIHVHVGLLNCVEATYAMSSSSLVCASPTSLHFSVKTGSVTVGVADNWRGGEEQGKGEDAF